MKLRQMAIVQKGARCVVHELQALCLAFSVCASLLAQVS